VLTRDKNSDEQLLRSFDKVLFVTGRFSNSSLQPFIWDIPGEQAPELSKTLT